MDPQEKKILKIAKQGTKILIELLVLFRKLSYIRFPKRHVEFIIERCNEYLVRLQKDVFEFNHIKLTTLKNHYGYCLRLFMDAHALFFPNQQRQIDHGENEKLFCITQFEKYKKTLWRYRREHDLFFSSILL